MKKYMIGKYNYIITIFPFDINLENESIGSIDQIMVHFTDTDGSFIFL